MDRSSKRIQQFRHNNDSFYDDLKFQRIVKTGAEKGEDGKRGP